VENDRLRLSFSAGLDDVLRAQIEYLEISDESQAAFFKSIGLGAFSSYSLWTGSKLAGMLTFGARRSTSFEAEELELQRAVADQLAVALDRGSLIQELAANNRKLAAANAELRRANTELEQFAFSASHDLREPIRLIHIYTELLRRKLNNHLDKDGQQCLEFVLSSANRLDLLVTDLLAYASVVHEDPVDSEIDANVVLRRVLSGLQPAIAESAATVHTGDLPALRMNEMHLGQLFHQLLQNALKFRCEATAPEIDISCFRNAGETVICIRDNGIGIAPEHHDKIFGVFKRLHASEAYEGTGIGLAICQKIVERYQGQIWVESEFGKGAVFCFRLGTQTNVMRSRAAGHV
jgi:light-regulated signal transduction histidine kinase (bacteriophytochrome)